MKVLRSNKDSVMAMLEAFVYDPLINWRLLNTNDATNDIVNVRDAEPKEGVHLKSSRPTKLHTLHLCKNAFLCMAMALA